MNILLFLPGLLVMLFQYRGVLGPLEAISLIAIIQVSRNYSFSIGLTDS